MTPFALAYVRQARALVHLADGQLAKALTAARTAIESAVQSRFRLELGAAQRVLGHETRGSGPTPRVPWRLACRLLGDHDVAGAETVPWHEALADAAAR